MIVKSDPRYPAARALCGDFAVQQNTSNRSQSFLNELMDASFRPVHLQWSDLWSKQQHAETAVGQIVLERDGIDLELDDATRRVLSALQSTVGKQSPQIKQYIPDGTLDIVLRPFVRQVSEMSAYAQAIAQATDDVLPMSTRDLFGTAYGRARDVQARLDAAKQAARDAQRSREAFDDDWDEAYEEYHRAAEYVGKGDRGVIKDWIREWPDAVYASKPAEASTATTTSTAPASSTGTDETVPPGATP